MTTESIVPKQISDSRKTALITGVSSGIGRALALYFRKRNVFVIGVSRRKPDIETDLWIFADITKEDGRQKIYDTLLQACPRGLDLLLNNAGMGIYATWEEMDEQNLRDVFELDFFAMVLLTKKLLPLLKKSDSPSVVNVSSSASRLWVPCMGAYCAVKAAAAMFSASLRPELHSQGIHVMDVVPGQINTGFSSRSFGMRRPPDAPGAKGDPSGLAEAVYRGWIRRKKAVLYPGWIGLGTFFVRAFIPGIYDAVSRRIWHLD